MSSTTPPVLIVLEGGRPIEFTYAEILRYHGHLAPGGVAHAFKVMQRGFPLLDGGATVERREIEIVTAFAGEGARDAFEAVTRAVTGGRFTVDPTLGRADRGTTMANYVFELRYRDRTVRLQVRPGHVRDDFMALARKAERTEAEERLLSELKLEMAGRIMARPAEDVYEPG